MLRVDAENDRKSKMAAFESLFSEHEAALYRYIRHLTESAAMAEDIYQETWLRAARQMNSGKVVRNLKNYLFTIATNIFRDELRRLQIRRFFLGPALENAKSAQDTWVYGESLPNEIEWRDDLRRAMEKLSTKQRIFFCLRHIEGFKISDISHMNKCADGTVKATIHKAVQKLRRELKGYQET
ncbi:RNA polymerase sigma factor [candidate division KSB1 bacterium]|nr:RNA polymerase sigma factor [candidate division KSB1 bacterium]RQW02106.1 MAG: RNA polymerase sigma factor [candidate division KSB1 bacterium]